jgi:hypothetical protein
MHAFVVNASGCMEWPVASHQILPYGQGLQELQTMEQCIFKIKVS